MVSAAFARIATVQAVLKAPSGIVDGKRTGSATDIAPVHVLPLLPASSDIVHRAQLQTPTKLLVTYFETASPLPVKEGCFLSVDGIDYPIKSLVSWPFGGMTRYELVLEDLRNR